MVTDNMASELQGDQSDKNSNSAVTKRLNKVLETRLDNDKDTLEALKELSVFFTENTLQSRRSLRSKIEKRSLLINEEFLSAFRMVKEALDSVYNDVSEMNNSVQNMTLQLQATKSQTHDLIEQTTKLQCESEKLTMQQDVAKSFLKTFQLSKDELAALGEANITEAFFSALDRVKSIHENCRTLLQSGHQTLGLAIMDQMAMYQEAALEKIYRWAQSHCRNIESPSMSNLLTQAMTRLQDRPVLFKYVMNEYCTNRRAILVRLFLDALTKGGAGGTPKPIEMHAHDAKRYVGDMLAWLHQAVPLERENLNTLLKSVDKLDVNEEIQQALANISEGVCHPLRVRVEHILSSTTILTSLYCAINFLRFYHQTFCQVIPSDSALVSTLDELVTLGERLMLTNVQNQVRHHLADRGDLPPPDLSPAQSVTHLLNLLKDILSVVSVAEGSHEKINKIVSNILDPLLQSVNITASRLSSVDMAVYLLNCLHHMQTMLALYQFMDDRLERLQAQSEAQIDTLTSEQANSLVVHLNLGPIYTILQDQTKGPLSQIPGMEPTSLSNFLSKLEKLLQMPELLLLPQVSCLMSGSHRSVVQRRATAVIVAIYTQLHQCVHYPANLYDNPAHIMPRTPQQVSQLLLG
ncbi:hypothetical protein LSTR_LSTR001638 [Laodelphax striatellus]|uniref:Conserved oligomeric Golgi complex subunit 6 n=1 Tax=Laodelphax striatellus TaxID=195883 RepID=A0A482XCG1_LAOST|nr:hypothetical protein LSTR_LSTR001638 [Laodelphax striatellus]